MSSQFSKRLLIAACIAVAVILSGVGLWWQYSGKTAPDVAQVNVKANRQANPLDCAVDAYNSGKYKVAETAATRIVESTRGSTILKKRRESVQARYVLAFSAARQKDMRLARERFTALRKEAAKLSDKGKQAAQPGVAAATLEEEGAYQHAVCTAALGNKKAAEAEYIKFMQDYPESPLIHGAVKRVELLHDGHLPKYAEDAWTKANNTAIARQNARGEAEEKKWSRCGPLCMAEILRRHGQTLDVDILVKELKTTSRGTTMQAMADVAKKHGLSPKGLALTQKGLSKQPLPLVALIMPGHYVIVEKVTADLVTVWDPYAKGIDKPGRTSYPIDRWKMMWGGVALVFEKEAGVVR